MPEDYPDFPHHTQIKAYLDAYADAFGLRDHIEFENGVVHAERLPGGGWEIDRPGRRRPAGSTCSWSPTATTGTRGSPSSRASSPASRSTPTTTSTRRTPLRPDGQADPRRRARQQRRRHRRRAVAARRCRTRSRSRPASSAWIVPKYIVGRPADKYFAHLAAHPAGLAAQGRPVDAVHDRLQPGALRPARRPTTSSSRRTRPSRSSCRCGSAPATSCPKPNVARLDGEHRALRGRHRRRTFDVIVYATGYNITFPFFDEEFLSAPGNRIRLYKRMFKPGHRRPGVHRLRPGGADAVPVRRGQARLLGGVRRRGATRCPTSTRWSG